MGSTYVPVPLRELPTGIKCLSPAHRSAPTCSCDSLAIDLMTDFSRTDPVTVRPQIPIDEANEHMKIQGVRSVLISDGDGRLLGFVSAADIQGDGPIRLQQEHRLPRSQVTVADIMLRLEQIPAVRLADITDTRVGDLTETFKQVGRHHVLVFNDDEDGNTSVCGMFSSRVIARALGVELTPSLQATTFAELWQALAS